MRCLFLALVLTLAACSGSKTDDVPTGPPEDRLTQAQSSADIRYLTSDALMGRGTGTPGNDSAAAYIARRFRDAGAVPAPGMSGYLQTIRFVELGSPQDATIDVGDDRIAADEMVMISGRAGSFSGRGVFVGFGMEASDYAEANGRIAVAALGTPEGQGVGEALAAVETKRELALRSGAVALVEIYESGVPWERVRGFLAGPRTQVMPDAEDLVFPHAWAQDGSAAIDALRNGGAGSVETPGMRMVDAPSSSNVVAVIPGSDPVLRDEYVALTAHFDHLGAGMNAGAGATPADSIFNGARDNGMGTTAVLAAADALGKNPPRRSVLLVAYTAEEIGLIGSRYFANHAPVALDQIVYNLNIDGGGYTDTTAITLIGKGRTTADPMIVEGAARYGLTVLDDPSPEQGLFDRSDNVSLARNGIPAPTFSPGFTSFSLPGVSNYYHRASDQADENFDFAYLHRFVQAYAHSARLIADADQRPVWMPGDTYEAAARALYGNSYPGE